MRAPTPLERFRTFGLPPRIMGLDIARALAVLGMVGAHMGAFGELNISQPETYFGLAHGRSSILFAVLAGVSVAIMTGRMQIPEQHEMPKIRQQLVARGAVIFLFGLFCELLNVPVAVILTFYGLLYIAVLPFIRMRPGALLIIAGAMAVVGPVFTNILHAAGVHGPGLDFILFGTYPLAAWLPLMLAGLAVGRMPLQSKAVAVGLVVLGAGFAVMAYGISALFGAAEGSNGTGIYRVDHADFGTIEQLLVGSLVQSFPHSGGTLEVFGSGGFVVAVIGVCLLIAQPLRWLLIPIAALGAMPLTAYTAHLIVIVLLWGPGNLPDSNAAWGWTSLGLIVGCTVLMVFYGRGPLERIVKIVADVQRDATRKGPTEAFVEQK